MDKEDLIKNINMTPLEKQIIINHSLKDPVYFATHYLKMQLTDEQKEFITRLKEGSEIMFIRDKINEKLNKVSDVNFELKIQPAPKNGAKIDLNKIIKDNEQNFKI